MQEKKVNLIIDDLYPKNKGIFVPGFLVPCCPNSIGPPLIIWQKPFDVDEGLNGKMIMSRDSMEAVTSRKMWSTNSPSWLILAM